MFRFVIRWVAMLLLLALQAKALPLGILVREQADGDCCSERLEFAMDGAAFCWQRRDPFAVKVHEIGGKLQVEVGGETRWVLSPNGEKWIDQDQRSWVRRESLVKTGPSWTKLRVRVVDQEKKALNEFGYRYRIKGKDGNWDPMLVRALRGKDGAIEIEAPAECRIFLTIEHPDFPRGYGEESELERKDGSAELAAEFQRGRTVHGTVLDDATGSPLAGAVVAPLMFTPPLFTEDDGRSRVTGADGVFELRGVKFSFSVSHREFLKETIYLKDEDSGKPHEVRLKTGIEIVGVVIDSEKKPLPGVTVDDGSGKSATTGDDGRFILKGLQKWAGGSWSLKFRKEGFDDFRFHEKEIGPEGLSITMQSLPVLHGRVVRADGGPVGKFQIICGPGANPAEYECVKAEVKDAEGRFAISPESLPEEGNNWWLGIRAADAAPWDGVVTQAALTSGDFQIVLKNGAALSGTLALPDTATGPIAVVLEPTDRTPAETMMVVRHPGKALATRSREMKRGEALRIPHLRAGNYQLTISCAGATPLVRPVVIGSDDVALGELQLSGTGSISGVANEPFQKGKIWRFADGAIYLERRGREQPEPFLKFKTGADGRFQVAGVPIGSVTVMFEYHASADIIDALVRKARVVEGIDTEVRFEGENGAWRQPLRLLFDGKEGIPDYQGIREVENVTDRAPMFRFEMTALGSGPMSGMDSEEWSADEKSGPVIADLSPGKWRIRVFDWLGSRGFDEGLRAETTADVGEKREPVTLLLGSKTLSGRITASRETKRLVQVIAVAKSSGRAFFSRCDDDGDFVVRFLPQDEYLVHAHDDDGGWCDLGRFPLDGALVDCGEHELLAGGNAEGKLGPDQLDRVDSIRISATAPDGVEIPVDGIGKDGSFRFGNLRPGKWTIIARNEGKEVLRRAVEIRPGKTAALKPGIHRTE